MKKNVLKSLVFCCSSVIMLGLFSNKISASTLTGECGADGDNLTYVIETGEGMDIYLSISGDGDMVNYPDSSSIPWGPQLAFLQSVEFSGNISSLGDYAFSNCFDLECIEIPYGVTTIGDYAFYGCTSLSTIVIPETVTSIGEGAFKDCSNLTNIILPEGIVSIEKSTFAGCSSLTSITIPESVNSIKDSAFSKCTSLKSITLTDGIESIGNDSFFECSELTSIDIPNSVTSIGYEAFWCCTNLENVTISENVETIPDCAFLACENLSSIIIPEGVTTIGSGAFAHCTNLKSVVINKDLYSEDDFPDIASDAIHFYYDVSYTNNGHGTVDGKTRTYGTDVLELTITPDDNYEIDNVVWTNGTETIELIPDASGLYVMPDSDAAVTICVAFKDARISEAKCGENIIWELNDEGTLTLSGFGDMSNYNYNYNNPAPWHDRVDDIKTVEFSGNITYIGEQAFRYCINLKEFTIPDTVTSIGHMAFSESGLISITIPGDLLVVPDECFLKCESLVSVIISEGVTTIRVDAFKQCTSLTNVTLPSSLETIDVNSFDECSSLTSVSIPEGVTQIGAGAFCECTNLTSIIIPYSTTTIGKEAFYGCSNLNSVVINKDAYSENAFPNLSSDIFHYYYDVSYADNGFGTVEGKTRTYGTDLVELVFSPKGSTTFDKVIWSDGTNTIELTPDTNGLYSMPDSDTGVTICATFVNEIIDRGNCGETSRIDWVLYADGTLTLSGGNNIASWPSQNDVPWYKYRDSITSVEFSGRITYISPYSFSNCSKLTSITIPDSVYYINTLAFAECENLTTVILPDRNITIIDQAFYGCSSINTVVLNRQANCESAFPGLSSENFHYYFDLSYDRSNKNGTITGPSRTYGTDVVEFSIVPDDGFELERLLCFTGNDIIELYPDANGICTMPDPYPSYSGSLYIIFRRVDYAYACGENLTWEVDGNTLIISGSGDMYDWDNQIRLNKVYYDRNSAPWFAYRNEIQNVVFDGKVTSIGNHAFAGCMNISSITIPDSVTVIGNSAFVDCAGLVEVSISEDLTTIGEAAFARCTSLEKMEIPEGVTSIGGAVFSGCTQLAEVEIPNSVTSIGMQAFYNCSSLTSITIPDGVTFSGETMFMGCTNLEHVELPCSIEYTNQEDSYWIGTFYGCNSLKSIAVPYGVIAISDSCFGNCTSLESVILPDAEITIFKTAFKNCSNLNNIVLNKSSYNAEAFSAYSSDTLHYYYDVSYTDNGHGTVNGKTRTYGTDEIEFSITPDDNYEINKVVWTNGTETIELISDANGLYVMPDSETDAEIQVIFATVEEKDFTISPIEDETYTGFEIIPIVRVFSGTEQLVYGTDFTVSYSNNVNVGTATVTVTGIGEYTGTKSTTFHITAKSVSDILYSPIEYQTYTGSPLTPSLDIRDGDKTLISGTDYTVAYSNNINVGEGTATITGKGNYTGTASNVIVIIPKSVSGVAISPISSQTYTGSNITPTFTVKDGNRTLVAGTDYTVSYSNNVNVGTATITITGKGNYTGSKSTTFQISTKSVSVLTVSSVASQTYTGSQITPSVTVKDGNKTLVSGKDYTVSYSNNVRAGTATITITGKGNYSGTKSSTFQISAKSVSGVAVSSVSSQMYTGSKIMPAITVKDGSKSLTAGTDYTVTYSNNVNVGTATITVTGKGNYTGSKSTTFQISTKSVSGLTVSSVASQTYTGSQITPVVTVKDGNRTLVAGTDYTVSYSNNVNAGTATVTITGKGNYAGTRNVSFTIVEPELTYTWAYESDSWYLYDNFNRLTTGFARVNGVTYYMNESGVMVTGWQLINYDWYYFNNSGAMETGWLYSGGDWYYLAGDGKMLTGFQTIGGVKYYLSGSGAMVTGWQCPYGDWYYFNSSGAMETGWLYSGGDWYYLASDGKMLTGFQTIGGVKYYLSGSGAMVSGWQYLYGDWYYFNSSGAMETGWLYSGGDWYYLGGDGKMLTGFQSIGGETYYLSSSGAMVTGWKQIGGNWYYFYSSGAMARSGNVNSGSKSYNFDSNGVCTNPYSDTPVYSYEYVWIPQTGKKYHTSSSCSGMNNPTRVTLSDAKSLGYTACQKCCN